MSKWNDLSISIPKINTYVYTLNKDLSEISYGKLTVCMNYMFDDGGFFKNYDTEPNITEGDLFWKTYGNEPDMEWNICWESIEDRPYWITPEDLLKIIINKIEIKKEPKINRLDILDL